jgi:CheY-like chemotaxis protein
MLPPYSPASRPLFILLAEDQADLREILARRLEADGAIVESVPDGQEALTRIFGARFRPDVIVSDVRMPKKTGLDVVHAVRAAGLSIPVILVTGFGQSVSRQEIDALPGTVLLEKPFDFDDLRTAVWNFSSIARLHSR